MLPSPIGENRHLHEERRTAGWIDRIAKDAACANVVKRRLRGRDRRTDHRAQNRAEQRAPLEQPSP